MRLVAYIRVSSSGQLDAYGPDAQLDDIRKWSRAHSHRIVAVKTDDISGTTAMSDRPALLECLDMLREPPCADGLVVANLGRLARELHIQEAILASVWTEGRRAYATDQDGTGEVLRDDPDDPMRTAMRQVQGAFAQLERALVVKRLRDGRRMKSQAGRKSTGQYAYGTHGVGSGRERDAAPLDSEVRAVERIAELRRQGASYRAICDTLDAEGLRPRRAASWSPMSVRNIAQRVIK